MTNSNLPTAAVLLIGDELLSGRTRDINLQQIAEFLAPLGIPVKECRTVSDVQADIIDAVNALRAKYTYVFTTGGIGPTHDDITADAIAAAFGVDIGENPEAMAILESRYAETNIELTDARRRMGRTPHGAKLVANAVSGAPGFQMENVFTMAGVPSIARAMLEDIGPRLETGSVVHSVTVRAPGLREGDIAAELGKLSDEMEEVSFGSYPWFRSIEDSGVHLVARTTRDDLVENIETKLVEIVVRQGRTPEIVKLDT